MQYILSKTLKLTTTLDENLDFQGIYALEAWTIKHEQINRLHLYQQVIFLKYLKVFHFFPSPVSSFQLLAIRFRIWILSTPQRRPLCKQFPNNQLHHYDPILKVHWIQIPKTLTQANSITIKLFLSNVTPSEGLLLVPGCPFHLATICLQARELIVH